MGRVRCRPMPGNRRYAWSLALFRLTGQQHEPTTSSRRSRFHVCFLSGAYSQLANNAGGVSPDHTIRGHTACDDGARGNDAAVPDAHARQDQRAGTDPGTVTDGHRLEVVSSAPLFHSADMVRAAEDHDLLSEVDAPTDAYRSGEAYGTRCLNRGIIANLEERGNISPSQQGEWAEYLDVVSQFHARGPINGGTTTVKHVVRKQSCDQVGERQSGAHLEHIGLPCSEQRAGTRLACAHANKMPLSILHVKTSHVTAVTQRRTPTQSDRSDR